MKLKFKNGGTVKLQNKGKVPNIISDHDKIVQYNLANGTHFYNMDQVMEHDAQRAASTNNKRNIWDILSGGSAESSGEAMLNRTIETANNAQLPETRGKIYKDRGKTELGVTVASLPIIPMLGEFSTYGLLGGASRLAGGFGGSAVGSYTLGKAGELGDRTFETTWMKPAGQVIGGFAGWVPGSNIAYKGALDLASKVPSIARIGATDRFIGDTAGRVLGKNVSSTSFIPAQVKYYGPTMGKSYAAKTNPNLIDLDTWGRSEYDQLAKKYGYKDWREMILSDKGDYNEEYKQLIKDQIRRIQSDPQYSGKTIVISNASLLKPSSGITFANTPVIPERSVMATRNNTRHPWESIEHGEEWWDSLQRKGTPLSIDNRFVSEIEGNKVISFTPTPQKFVSTIHFDSRVKPLSRSISEAERLGLPKGKRSNPKALEDPQYWGYQQWNQRYNAAVESGNWDEAQRLRDLHFKIKAPDTKVIDENGMPLHMYHGITDRHNWKRFQQYRGVNWDVERAVKAGDKRSHWKISEHNTDVMSNYHTPNYKIAIGLYGLGKQDLVYDDYLNITKPSTWGEDIHNLINSEYPGYSEKILHTIPAHHHTMTGELVPSKQIVEYTGVPDWARFNGLARKILMKHGYDGLYIPQYYDSYGAFVSPSQFKSADPITWNGRGEIIPIVKRDNFHNLDRRYKQGGILKAQRGTFKDFWNALPKNQQDSADFNVR